MLLDSGSDALLVLACHGFLILHLHGSWLDMYVKSKHFSWQHTFHVDPACFESLVCPCSEMACTQPLFLGEGTNTNLLGAQHVFVK